MLHTLVNAGRGRCYPSLFLLKYLFILFKDLIYSQEEHENLRLEVERLKAETRQEILQLKVGIHVGICLLHSCLTAGNSLQIELQCFC